MTAAVPAAGVTRTIVHVDMDAFFVACEVRRRPELQGLPVVVGGNGPRGVVAAASYEARRFGIHSAMPAVRAQRLCPHATFVSGDHALYSEVSAQVQDIFRRYTPLIEMISLDEGFLDVTGGRRLFGTGETIGHALREAIRDELALTCSVGVAPNKMAAKLASEAAKPKASASGIQAGRGVVVVTSAGLLPFLHRHRVEALWGVGPKTLQRLQRLGIATIGELANASLPALVASLGHSHGHHLSALARGVDDRAVEPERQVRSIGHEQTFPEDLHERGALEREIVRMADSVAARARVTGVSGRTVQIKVRFGDFRTITRSKSIPNATCSATDIVSVARVLLAEVDIGPGVRLLGVSLASLTTAAPQQLTMDAPAADWHSASQTVDDIRRRFGPAAIGPASLVEEPGGQLRRLGVQPWGPTARESGDP